MPWKNVDGVDIVTIIAGGIIGGAIAYYGSNIEDALSGCTSGQSTNAPMNTRPPWCEELYDKQSCK